METINDTNYELWLVRYADGSLTAAEREAVEAWLSAHPEAAEELRLYGEAPRLQRDEAVRYVAVARQHTVPLWPRMLRWSAAAAVVAALAVPAVRLLAPHEEPVLVAQASVEAPLVAPPSETASTRTVPVVHADVVTRRAATPAAVAPTLPVLAAQADAEAPRDASPAAEFLDEPATSFMAQVEPEEANPTETRVEVPAAHLVYVDNLFTIDSGDAFSRQLVALADSTRERLQGSYLGRRLARRMPDDAELMAMVDERRQQMPQGIRIMTDFIIGQPLKIKYQTFNNINYNSALYML